MSEQTPMIGPIAPEYQYLYLYSYLYRCRRRSSPGKLRLGRRGHQWHLPHILLHQTNDRAQRWRLPFFIYLYLICTRTRKTSSELVFSFWARALVSFQLCCHNLVLANVPCGAQLLLEHKCRGEIIFSRLIFILKEFTICHCPSFFLLSFSKTTNLGLYITSVF